MSKRTSIMDDKLISEMTMRNIATAAQMNISMADIFDAQQMRIMTAYEEAYNYQSSLSFFLSLGIMSHFSQGSYYTHYASSDHRPVQLYLWLLGPSGSGKTHAFRQLEKAITKTEKMFPSVYLKPVMVSGKLTEADLSSIVTHTNHIGLRQHLASNHKILLNDDADLIAENYGLYNVNDYTKEHERNIILCGYDGFSNTSRTTGTTIIHIGDKRLTIAIATTGGKLMKNMKNWINCTGFDGSHNRFLYLALPKLAYSRPQHFKVNANSKKNPSFAHLGVIVHLFGTVRYVFEMSESERSKFCGALFEQPIRVSDEEEQTQTQQHGSAMFTVWNLIADLVETQDQKQHEQQQIVDFYAKSGSTFPRLACLMQMYLNAITILEEVKETVSFAEGDVQDIIINENFITSVKTKIKKDYYTYDKTYLPSNENNQIAMDPIIIVKKDAVIAAWKWYEHHLNIASTLFTIDYEFSGRLTTTSSTILCKPKTLKQMIMLFDFNIFPISAVTAKHPVTGQTGIFKNRPALGECALQELLNDNLIKFNYFLTDIRGRNVKSYMKMPLPSICNLQRQQFINKLLKHEIYVDEYLAIYEKSSIPSNNNFSKFTTEIFEHTANFVTEYSKYRNQLNTVIHKHLNNSSISELEDGSFIIKNQESFNREIHAIENLDFSDRLERRNSRYGPVNLQNKSTNELTNHLVMPTNTPVQNEIICINPIEQNSEVINHDLPEFAFDEQSSDTTDNVAKDIQNCSLSALSSKSDIDNSLVSEIDEESSDALICKSTHEELTTDAIVAETAVKKAMKAIMIGRSVIYTKTDLTQICKKPSIRLEAIKRLVEVDLIQHGSNFWIEPNRSKKESNKIPKRLLREGWLKKGPDNPSDVSKFQFIQVLQENVNISYDDYMQSFYPRQIENVFTNNNWTLSDELIEIFSSNFFYKQYVRWNINRFRPVDIERGVINAQNEAQLELAQDTHLARTTDNLRENTQQELTVGNNEEEIAHTTSVTTRSKRKVDLHECFSTQEALPQTRKAKKH